MHMTRSFCQRSATSKQVGTPLVPPLFDVDASFQRGVRSIAANQRSFAARARLGTPSQAGGHMTDAVLGKGLGARRVQLGERSPAKRPKRMSLLAVSSARIAAQRLKAMDPNASVGDLSFRSGSAAGGSKPTWR